MARFDVYPNPGAHASTTPYLLDVQTGLLDGLDSRVVIPLRSLAHFAKVKLPTRLTPVLQVNGQDYLLETPKMGSVPGRILKNSVASLSEQQEHITGALDFLFQGY
ncbi:MAG: CcdB family protein [Rhodoferax sp.]|nr:CcdB family protein [Rhodoferax sp.]